MRVNIPLVLSRAALLSICAFAAVRAAAQAGPPFQTDDSTPVDYGHYEFYVFGSADGTPAATAAVGPAFEFNWGAVPNVQLHAIFPFGVYAPSNKPVYAGIPAAQGSRAFGVSDMEFGL